MGVASYLDDIELVNVALPGEERLSVKEFGHDASNSPEVHLLAISSAAKQKLWGTVPTGRHIVGDVHIAGGGKMPCESKVTELSREVSQCQFSDKYSLNETDLSCCTLSLPRPVGSPLA